MSVADELDRLHRLHQDGVLTDEELDRGRAAVLVDPLASPTAEQLEEIRRQKEAAQLDREWEAERERYMVTERFGYRYIPGRMASIALGALNVAFGVVWVVVCVINGLPVYFLGVGVVVAVVGGAGWAHLAVKGSRYLDARRRYQRRRAAVLNRGDTADPPR
jgi:membrane protein required for beta-lactamase induction